MEDGVGIGRAVRARLIELDMRPVDLAHEAHLSESYVSMLLNGKIPDPKLSKAAEVAEALDMSIRELWERSRDVPAE